MNLNSLMKRNQSKIKILETSKFFDSPRTVTETVEQLKIWMAASPLDVSKAPKWLPTKKL